jgi:hypothetical protein
VPEPVHAMDGLFLPIQHMPDERLLKEAAARGYMPIETNYFRLSTLPISVVGVKKMQRQLLGGPLVQCGKSQSRNNQ